VRPTLGIAHLARGTTSRQSVQVNVIGTIIFGTTVGAVVVSTMAQRRDRAA
jgi:hypothetical protein